MRLLALTVCLLLLAGCASTSTTTDSSSPDAGGKDPRQGRPGQNSGTTTGPNGTVEETPHRVVNIVSQPIQLVANQPVSYQATIANGTFHVTATIELGGTAETSFVDGLKVALEGCGSYSDATIGGSTGGQVGPMLICDGEAAVGSHTVTISTTGGVIKGTFKLDGWLPQ